MMLEWDEAWARIEWQAERGGRMIWLSGEDGVETSSLIARAISDWQQAGYCVLFADLSQMDGPEASGRTVLLRLLGPHADRARATVSLWRRLDQVLATAGSDVRIILDRIELAQAPCRSMLSTIRHLVTRHRATLVVASPRNVSARSRILAAWADLEIGRSVTGGVTGLVA